jgi:predicted nucleotidyltransferase
MQLDRDFKEFVSLLNAHNVRYLIVGGYAVAAHGLPRYTGDFDTWIWLSKENAKKVLDVLEEFGFGGLAITEEDFSRENSVVQLGQPPHRIDLLTSISGVSFEDAWLRRLDIDIDGEVVGFIGREDLITNKREVGRPQDLADVARLMGDSDK